MTNSRWDRQPPGKRFPHGLPRFSTSCDTAAIRSKRRAPACWARASRTSGAWRPPTPPRCGSWLGAGPGTPGLPSRPPAPPPLSSPRSWSAGSPLLLLLLPLLLLLLLLPQQCRKRRRRNPQLGRQSCSTVGGTTCPFAWADPLWRRCRPVPRLVVQRSQLAEL